MPTIQNTEDKVFKSLQYGAAIVTILGFIVTIAQLLPSIDIKLTELKINFFVRLFIYLFVELCFSYIFAKILNLISKSYGTQIGNIHIPSGMIFSSTLIVSLFSAWQTVSIALMFFHKTGDSSYIEYLIFPLIYSTIILLTTSYDDVYSEFREELENYSMKQEEILEPFLRRTTLTVILYVTSYIFVSNIY